MKQVSTVSARMYALVVLYDLHTDYFHRVLDKIDDKDTHNRLNTKANHIAWLTGSLVQERFEMAALFGPKEQQKAHELFDNHKGIQEGVTYPSLKSFKDDWDRISPVFRKKLTELSDEQLEKPFSMEGFTMSHFELLSFMIYREANCIGQLALWRRLLGYPPMNYM
jgi:hypothetical protein